MRQEIRYRDQHDADYGFQQTHCGTEAELHIDQAHAIDIGVDDIRRRIHQGIIHIEHLIKPGVQNVAQRQRRHQHDGRHQCRQRHMHELFPAVGSVDGGRVKQLRPEVLLMISSAYGDFEYTQKAIQFQVDAYILKPVVVAEFHAALQRVLGRLERRDQLLEQRRKLLEEYRDANYYQREKLLQTLLDGEAESPAEPPEDTAANAIITRAQTLIQENYQKDIGLEWVAEQIYLSPGYLSGLFKRETGKSIIQYITILRMEKARELLTQTNRKIADIAQAVGYNNASYFCLLFRKYYGVTAHQMRDQEVLR